MTIEFEETGFPDTPLFRWVFEVSYHRAQKNFTKIVLTLKEDGIDPPEIGINTAEDWYRKTILNMLKILKSTDTQVPDGLLAAGFLYEAIKDNPLLAHSPNLDEETGRFLQRYIEIKDTLETSPQNHPYVRNLHLTPDEESSLKASMITGYDYLRPLWGERWEIAGCVLAAMKGVSLAFGLNRTTEQIDRLYAKTIEDAEASIPAGYLREINECFECIEEERPSLDSGPC